MSKNNRKLQMEKRKIKNPFDDFLLDDRISIVGLSTFMDAENIRRATDVKYVIQDNPHLPIVRNIPRASIDKFRAVSNRYTLGSISRTNYKKIVARTWPSKWEYFSDTQIKNFKRDGLIRKNEPLMEVISGLNFGEFIFEQTNVQKFLDTFAEISWIDYAIRQQLDYYDEIYTDQYITLGIAYEFNPHVAKCWITLENCVIRISSLWDRIRLFLLPLYFIGQTFEELKSKLKQKYVWQELDKKISMVISDNLDQKELYNQFVTASNDFNTSEFKALRNRVIHEFVFRPEGAVPTGINAEPALNKVEDLHKLVLREFDRVHEVIVIFVAMILKKQPKNLLQNSD